MSDPLKAKRLRPGLKASLAAIDAARAYHRKHCRENLDDMRRYADRDELFDAARAANAAEKHAFCIDALDRLADEIAA